jgi:coenzyme F420-reducing hydrogenase beta subunit
MIEIKDKSQCCGCEACVQRCPKQCISLVEDKEGFFYPQVDKNVCVDCGLCEKVCPIINQFDERQPQVVYAAINSDSDVRQSSSSGGIFSALADAVLSQGGVVFGVCWDKDWRLVFNYTENKEDLFRFRGSKYLQAYVGDAYIRAEQFLKIGRQVLFTGTPCQIAALRRYLKKDYDNLSMVDVICHGAPSPQVWKKYLDEQLQLIEQERGSRCQIASINFRDKSVGWKNYNFSIRLKRADGEVEYFTQPSSQNIFMRGFLRDFYLRPSCYSCPAKSGRSGSDITLGDFWGINELNPEIDDDRGVSAITINSDKGALWFDKLSLQRYVMSYDDLCRYNPAFVRSVACPPQRAKFFKRYGKKSFFVLVENLCRKMDKVSYYDKIKWNLRRVYRLIFK